MSFRARLTLFFVLIVVVPMVALSFVLFRLIADNENGKADAGLAAQQQTAQALVGQATAAAATGAARLVDDQTLATALQDRDLITAGPRAQALLATLHLKRIVIGEPGQPPTIDVGAKTAVFPVRKPLQGSNHADLGILQVSATGPRSWATAARRLVGVDVVVRRTGETLAATLPASANAALPATRGTIKLGSTKFRAGTFSAPAFTGQTVSVSVLRPRDATATDIRNSRLLAAGILLGFFVLAFTFAVLVSRSLQRQIGGFLDAAKRLGRGDFSAKVPTFGSDEFAELGGEFNRMGSELEQKVEDLESEQRRLESAMRRIGETFASNLDREALLEIVLSSALDATNAVTGRTRLPERGAAELVPAASVGPVTPALTRAQDVAEALALEDGTAHESRTDGIHALAHPLTPGSGRSGVVSVARPDRPFTPEERELFGHLVSRAAVSLENVALHKAVERQAVTDGLTGLANRRRLEEVLDSELERSRRFHAPVALVMLDIDNFKKVNDTHGHQVGDDVLREVARVLKESSREIDEPARYGGEELAIVLPGTDLDGAFAHGERVRRGIEALAIPLPAGGILRVTASLGAATHPGSAVSPAALVQAADLALYEAKHAGKNRTRRAHTPGAA